MYCQEQVAYYYRYCTNRSNGIVLQHMTCLSSPRSFTDIVIDQTNRDIKNSTRSQCKPDEESILQSPLTNTEFASFLQELPCQPIKIEPLNFLGHTLERLGHLLDVLSPILVSLQVLLAIYFLVICVPQSQTAPRDIYGNIDAFLSCLRVGPHGRDEKYIAGSEMCNVRMREAEVGVARSQDVEIRVRAAWWECKVLDVRGRVDVQRSATADLAEDVGEDVVVERERHST
jgi:hypothetical protein